MSEDSFVEFTGNLAIAKLNDLNLNEPIGGSNILYFLKIERISDKIIRMAIWSSNMLTVVEECNLSDMGHKITNKRTPMIQDLTSLFGGESLPPLIDQKLRMICRIVQEKWLGKPISNEDVKDSEMIINDDRFTDYRDDVLEEAERVLISDDVIGGIKRHLDHIIAGEDDNKLMVFVLALTGKSKDSKKKTIICAIHEAGAGKTWILKNIAAFYKSHTVSHLTKKALNYLGEQLEDKEILFLKELGNMDREEDTTGNASIKMLSVDDGGLTTTYVSRDESTGKFLPHTVNTKPITVMTSTTRLSLDEQFVRRYWVFSPDASIKQTERIKRFSVIYENQENLVLLGLRKYTDMDYSQWVLRAIIDMMEDKEIIVPFMGSIFDIMDTTRLRIRSDYGKVGLFLKMYGMLTFRHLPFYTTENKIIYILTPEKAIEALKIARRSLVYMARDTEARVYDLVEALKSLNFKPETDEQSGTLIDVKKRKLIGDRMGGKSMRSISRYLQLLEWYGYAMTVGKDKNYVLLYNPEQIESMLSGYKDLTDEDLTEELYNKMIEEGNEFFKSNNMNIKFDNRKMKLSPIVIVIGESKKN